MRMSHAWHIRITPFLVGEQLCLQSDYTQQPYNLIVTKLERNRAESMEYWNNR